MVRATLAEPELVVKTITGRHARSGRASPCLQELRRRSQHAWPGDVHGEPSAGRELTHGDAVIPSANPPLQVVVVGGGPAGMEAARTAAIAGHAVTLLEAADALGGQLRLVREPPRSCPTRRFLPLTKWIHTVWTYGWAPPARHVRSGTRAGRVGGRDRHEARTDGFQALRPTLPLPGLDTVTAYTGWDVLGGVELGHTVVLLDEIGHYESLDVARRLVAAGHRVHQVSRYALSAPTWRCVGKWPARRSTPSCCAATFILHPRSVLLGLEPGIAHVAPHEHRSVDADPIRRHRPDVRQCSDRALQDELATAAPIVRVIGDANSPRRVGDRFRRGAPIGACVDERLDSALARYGWAGSAT